MSVNKLSENFKVLIYYEDDQTAGAGVFLPADAQATTDNVPTGWIDFRDYEKGMCLAFNISGANAWSKFLIVSNTASNGSGTDNTVKTLTTPGTVTAALQTAMLEWTASDITDGDRYISAQFDAAGADPMIAVYFLENRRYKTTGLTTATETAST